MTVNYKAFVTSSRDASDLYLTCKFNQFLFCLFELSILFMALERCTHQHLPFLEKYNLLDSEGW